MKELVLPAATVPERSLSRQVAADILGWRLAELAEHPVKPSNGEFDHKCLFAGARGGAGDRQGTG